MMLKPLKRIWGNQIILEEWKTTVICPIYKGKGDKLSCNNYREILLDVEYKILTSIVKERLDEFAERILGKYQAGF